MQILKKILSRSDYCIIFSDLFQLFIKHNPDKIIEDLNQIINFLLNNKKTIILPTFNLNFPKTKKLGFQKNTFKQVF